MMLSIRPLPFVALGFIAVGACSTTDRGFEPAPAGVFPEAGSDAEDKHCDGLRCSYDGRSVVKNCTDEVVTACPPELACGGAECVEPCVAAEREKGSRGCEFFFQPPPLYSAIGITFEDKTGCYAAYLVNTSATPSTVRLEYGGKDLDLTGAIFTMKKGDKSLLPHEGPVAPGEAVVLFLADPPGTDHIKCPAGVRPATTENPDRIIRGTSTSFHLTASVPVSASTIFPFGGAASTVPTATLLLPTSTWGKEHVVIEPWSMGLASNYNRFGLFPAVQIVAKEDDTVIEIRPTADIQDDRDFVGAPKGAPATYRINRGQYLQIAQADELTGSIVTSSKPTTVFGAHSCMLLPQDVMACDTAQQQIPSFAQWGSEYAAVGHLPRLGDSENSPYRIVAAVDGTELTYDPAPPGGAPTKLDSGAIGTFWTRDPFVVRSQDAEHPIYVAGYMTGCANVNPTFSLGDPEFVNVIPTAQYLNDYSFFADPTYPNTSLVVIRVRGSQGFDDVNLDCAGGPLSGFRPLGTDGRFEYVRIPLTDGGQLLQVGAGTCGYGLHHMSSRSPFTATLWGLAKPRATRSSAAWHNARWSRGHSSFTDCRDPDCRSVRPPPLRTAARCESE
ncbi:hypothetical protein AKJ09_06907 [Labilithrix luteola]|uniref:IgGFc-binding protein N-terminal domain-containing protein n=1 Tax=Labilithrix luteola TaxID=1391654 RepID=A0A0K1Q3A3_9BACT|nr:IgGFc-binding protein [Labilithrix luteola]AKV00244.1 hypothetical protein AKJ09_06907 [Labilithrix luteola]